VRNEPFHDGEITVQRRTGEREAARRHGAAIADRIVPGALPFLEAQRLVAVSGAAEDGRLWASVWCGTPGFIRSTEGRHLNIRPQAMSVASDDPVWRIMGVGSDIGILAIELASRRRLRINGTVERLSSAAIDVRVRESVANCPKYIQRRRQDDVPKATMNRKSGQSGRTIDSERRASIEGADTSFVGSIHPVRGMDVSHRGGEPGFIRVIDSATLRIPDYPGNSMFMTLGNFEVDPRTSMAILDFERRRVVSFSGSARLRFGQEDSNHPSGGTGRYWDLVVREWVQFDLPRDAPWELIDRSPFNPAAREK
jgi:predicted pyridoxine 5'-phosphate oxidase superfamily flavin-nucleotide-binding protein